MNRMRENSLKLTQNAVNFREAMEARTGKKVTNMNIGTGIARIMGCVSIGFMENCAIKRN